MQAHFLVQDSPGGISGSAGAAQVSSNEIRERAAQGWLYTTRLLLTLARTVARSTNQNCLALLLIRCGAYTMAKLINSRLRRWMALSRMEPATSICRTQTRRYLRSLPISCALSECIFMDARCTRRWRLGDARRHSWPDRSASSPAGPAGLRADLASGRQGLYSKGQDIVSTPKTRLERAFDPQVVRDLKPQLPHDVSVGGPALAAHAIRAMLGGGRLVLPSNVCVRLDLLDERRFTNGNGLSSLLHAA